MKEATLDLAPEVLAPAVDTKIDIDQTQIISFGIAQKENSLDAALHENEQKLRPLIARHQEMTQEIYAALPKIAEKACEPFKTPLTETFKLLGTKLKFEVTGAGISTANGKRGQATFKVTQQSDSHSSYSGISQVVSFDLPEDILERQEAIKTLDLQLAAGRAYAVELKKALQNLPREERNLRGRLAQHVLGKSAQGRELLEVIGKGILPLPEAPDLLQLGNGTPAPSKRARRSK